MRKYSISDKAYQNKLQYIAEYNKKQARLTIQLRPEEKEQIKQLAAGKGLTIKDFILQAVLGEGNSVQTN